MTLTKIGTNGINDEAVNLTKLPHGTSSNDGKFLRANNGADPTFETVNTTPEGTAILSTGESGGSKFLREDGDGSCSWQSIPAGVGGATGVDFNDSVKARFGDGNDLQIYHDGSNPHSLVTHNGSGHLKLSSNNDIHIRTNNTDKAIQCNTTAGVDLFFANTKKAETVSGGFTVTGTCTGTTIADSKGDLRKIPASSKSSAYTLQATDAGTLIYISSGGITVPVSAFVVGQAVSIINNSGSDQTITQGSGMTLYNTGDATTGNRTLAGRGMATIWFADYNIGYISGAGLS